jgi:hypothetical protein
MLKVRNKCGTRIKMYINVVHKIMSFSFHEKYKILTLLTVAVIRFISFVFFREI